MTAHKQTLQESLRASFEAARGVKTHDFEIPGYEPQLFVTLKRLTNYRQIRESVTDLVDGPTLEPADLELEVAIRTLLLANTDVYVEQDGKRQSLGKLGLDLFTAMYGEPEEGQRGPTSDAEALQGDAENGVLGIFQSSVDLMAAFDQYNDWTAKGETKAQERLLGE
jgi:hypothetical protein